MDITTRVLATPFLTHTKFIIVFNTLTIACALLRPYKHRTANISGVTLPAICSSETALLIVQVINVHRKITVMNICAFLLSLPHCVSHFETEKYSCSCCSKVFLHTCICIMWCWVAHLLHTNHYCSDPQQMYVKGLCNISVHVL